MNTDFSKNLIKSYKYWEIYIHENQSYLGRCVIWCKRKQAEDMIDATKEEQEELFTVIKELHSASKKCFNPDWFNYSFLGNDTRHLHCHFIPRYKEPKIFAGVSFKDELYGHNYKTDRSFLTPKELLEIVKNDLQKALS